MEMEERRQNEGKDERKMRDGKRNSEILRYYSLAVEL
jgi:hypothetical protein